jgi:Zinc knuckle
LCLLDGCAYSDRYYIHRILAGMQPALRIHFEPAINHLCLSSPIDHALPSQLHPLSLVGTLTQRAKELGHPEYMALTTRTLQDAPMHELELEMHAVLGVHQCYICQSTMHTMRDCPTHKHLEEPAIRRQLGLPLLPTPMHQIAASDIVVDPVPDVSPLDPVDPSFH